MSCSRQAGCETTSVVPLFTSWLPISALPRLSRTSRAPVAESPFALTSESGVWFGPNLVLNEASLRRAERLHALSADEGFDGERRASRAILAHEDARRDESRRMGKPMRRLRPLLPRQARGRGHGRDSFHRYRLQAARRQDVPMHRLSAPSPEGSRLRAADGGCGAQFELAPGHLRLSTGGQRTRTCTTGIRWFRVRPTACTRRAISVRGRVSVSESDLAPEHWPDRIVKWPNRKPRARR